MLHHNLPLLPAKRSLTAAHPELCIQLVQARFEVVIQLALHLRDACALDVQGAQGGIGGVSCQLVLQATTAAPVRDFSACALRVLGGNCGCRCLSGPW